MRVRTWPLALTVLMSIAGCEREPVLSADIVEASSGIPAAVTCGNASQLRQRAANDRSRVGESRSDHERISVGSRANFLATLAVIADLKCKVTDAQADDAIKPALEAARRAEETDSVYEKTRGFNDAGFAAMRAIALLTERLPAPPAK
jgi:hypothetical protein